MTSVKVPGRHARGVFVALAALLAAAALAQGALDVALSESVDIGRVDAAGSSERLESGYVVEGGGADIWGEQDAFHFAFGRLDGDFAVTVRVAELEGPAEWGKAGVMVRAGASPGADYVATLATVGGRVTSQYRAVANDETTSVSREVVTPHRWLRLVREGPRLESWYSRDGERWHLLREVEHLMPSEVLVGLAVTSHAEGSLARAAFDHVSFTRDLASLDVRPESGSASTRLHATSEEIAEWRRRAGEGPYRTYGDASTHSPGDWERILANADEFLERPEWRHWVGNTGNSCYQRGDAAPHDEPATNIRDAAFVYLVTEEARYRDAVRDELLALAREPGTDFSDDRRWCTGRLGDGNPAIEIANWFTKLLFAYDYLGDEAFDRRELAELDAWFLEAARYFAREVHHDLSTNFADRAAGDYTLTADARRRNDECDEVSHYGGWRICSLAMYYNNRRALQARFFGLVGLKLGDERLQEEAKRFVREWVRYSMYPDGVVGEFERWTDSLPDLGWDYAAAAISSIVTLADHFARAGDRELYEYKTTEGYFGTQSEPGREKSLLLGIRNLQSYLLPEVERYATRRASEVGDPDRRIDGVHEPADWYSAADVVIVPANLYYQEDDVRAIYDRSHPEVDPYPAADELAQRGPEVPWAGDWGIYPGVLFMYGGLEGVVDPYP